MKKALITGVTGQDGSYLSELLLEKNYKVYGIQRRTSWPNTERIDHLYDNPAYPNFVTVYGDLSESSNVSRIIEKIQPDEIYNLGAQSHVGISYDIPEYTANVTGLGALRVLDAIKNYNYPIKYYQASSSEMFGKVLEIPQDENTPFNPQSPYAISKIMAYHFTKAYRNSYGLFASNGILFNHESPRRGLNFVTRKISLGLSRVKLGILQVLKLGNLNASRDWGFSKDYVEAIWLILQHNKPDDFIISTGETHTIREFAEEVGKVLGMEIIWKGEGVHEKGINKKSGKVVIEVDPSYYRKSEVEYLLGNSAKAYKELGWKPKTSFKKLVEIMVKYDYHLASQEKKSGTKIEVQETLKI